MSYIASDGTKWNGVVPDAEHKYLQCEKCGSKKIRMVSHFDGREIYGYDYNCENGHIIRQTIKRWGCFERAGESE